MVGVGIGQSIAAGIHNAAATAASAMVAAGKPEMRKTTLNNRHSNESGIYLIIFLNDWFLL